MLGCTAAKARERCAKSGKDVITCGRSVRICTSARPKEEPCNTARRSAAFSRRVSSVALHGLYQFDLMLHPFRSDCAIWNTINSCRPGSKLDCVQIPDRVPTGMARHHRSRARARQRFSERAAERAVIGRCIGGGLLDATAASFSASASKQVDGLYPGKATLGCRSTHALTRFHHFRRRSVVSPEGNECQRLYPVASYAGLAVGCHRDIIVCDASGY